MVMLWGDLLTTWTATASPSVTSTAGPGSWPLATVTSVSLHRCAIFTSLTYMYEYDSVHGCGQFSDDNLSEKLLPNMHACRLTTKVCSTTAPAATAAMATRAAAQRMEAAMDWR